MENPDRAYYSLTFPEGLNHKSVEAFINVIGGLPLNRPKTETAFVYEVWGDTSGIHYRLSLNTEYNDLIEQLRAHVRGMHIKQDSGESLDYNYVQEYGLSSDIIPLLIANPADAAASILTSLQPVHDGENAAIQWVIAPSKRKPPKIKMVDPVYRESQDWGGGAMGVGAGMIDSFGTKLNNLLQDKFSEWHNKREAEKEANAAEKWQPPMFEAICRIGVRTTQRDPLLLHNRIFNAMQSSTARVDFKPKNNEQAIENMKSGVIPDSSWPFDKWPCFFNKSELSALLAFPIDSPNVAGLELGGSHQAPASIAIPSEGHIVAYSDYSGTERPLAIPWKETLRHTVTFGKTGSGKSNLLASCAYQDMLTGSGLLFIDPKGDVVEKLLDTIPAGREKDVIYLNPADTSRVVGLNLFADSLTNPELAASNFVSMFKKLYKKDWGARMEAYLITAVYTLTAVPDVTILDIAEILTNEKYRKTLLSRYPVSYELEKSWAEYEALKSDRRAEEIQPLINRLKQFSLRPTIRRVVGQTKPALDMPSIIASKKIVLANLDEGAIGEETSHLLGSILMLSFWQALQKRPLPERTTPYFCYVDEFQNFLNLPTPLGDLLAKARGFGGSMFLATQQLSKLDSDTQRDLMANTNNAVYFNMAAEDAAKIAKQYPSLETDTFTTLGQFEAVVSISTGGSIHTKPTVGKTYPNSSPTGSLNAVYELSMQNYARDCTEIDNEITKRREAFLKTAPVGGREIEE